MAPGPASERVERPHGVDRGGPPRGNEGAPPARPGQRRRRSRDGAGVGRSHAEQLALEDTAHRENPRQAPHPPVPAVVGPSRSASVTIAADCRRAPSGCQSRGCAPSPGTPAPRRGQSPPGSTTAPKTTDRTSGVRRVSITWSRRSVIVLTFDSGDLRVQPRHLRPGSPWSARLVRPLRAVGIDVHGDCVIGKYTAPRRSPSPLTYSIRRCSPPQSR